MSLTRNQIASWADIQALYTAMNVARSKFSISTVNVPGNPGIFHPDNVSALNTLVNAMSSNSFLSDVAVTGVTVPRRSTPIEPNVFSKISQTITNIQNTCAHCSFSDCFSCSCGIHNTFGFDGRRCTGFGYR